MMYTLIVWLHVLLASAWIGAMIFFVVAMVPVLRDPDFSDKAALLVQKTGYRLRVLGWTALGLLLVTGLLGLHFRGFSLEVLSQADFWRSGFGKALRHKLEIVSLILVVSGVHDFWLGPKASRRLIEAPGSPDAMKLRKAASWMGRLTLVLSLLVLWYAVRMVRGV